MSSQRTRNWVFILYPESAPDNWKQILGDYRVPFIVSPLHDLDVDAFGEVKKEHYHVLLLYDGVKSFEQVKQLTDRLNQPIPQYCFSVPAMVRYFAHMDDPDKHRYRTEDIEGFCGADVQSYLSLTYSQRNQIISDILAFIDKQKITEFSDIVRYARVHRPDDWFDVIINSGSFVISSYIKSCRHGAEMGRNPNYE